MQSDTDIVNRALAELGLEPIVDLAVASAVTDFVRPLLPMMRREVLAEHPWNCAVERQSLRAATVPPRHGFAYAYPLPAGALRVLAVDTDEVWQVEGRSIVTDAASPLPVTLLMDVATPGLLPPHVAGLIALRLAAVCCQRFTQSGQSRDALLAHYRAALREARSADAMEGTPDEPEPSAWLAARG